MAARRILSLWFPRLGAEQVMRAARGRILQPFAITAEIHNSLILKSLSKQAEQAGLKKGQLLRDATALCPELLTHAANPLREQAFLDGLVRWAGRWSPWVATEGEEALVMDITGCAHLFGGEQAMTDDITEAARSLRLSVQYGLADTRGCAWALARFAGEVSVAPVSGDAIVDEAHATRVRATKRRHWERGGPAPARPVSGTSAACRIAAPGHAHTALAPLPIAALRLPEETVVRLARVGLRRIADLLDLPRAPLARRYGQELTLRLDQALGQLPEPISPRIHKRPFAVRLSLPDPIGLEEDLIAALDRLLPPLCQHLKEAGRGARRLRLSLHRVDHTIQLLEAGLARPADEVARIRPLLLLQLPKAEAGYGIDLVRLEAFESEPLPPQQHRGHADALRQAQRKRDQGTALTDLLGRLGARIGPDALTRLHPASSHIAEKTATIHMAGYSVAAADWPDNATLRPLRLFAPEPVTGACGPHVPMRFRWRRRQFTIKRADGPERITPEWWLDDPNWRSGTRDYWRVETGDGARLWLFYAHGGEISGGWFCQGDFQ